MFEMLLNLIFTVITRVADLVLAPIMAVLTQFIPDLTTYLNGIMSFITYALSYIKFGFAFFRLPSYAPSLMLLLFTTNLAIITGVRTYTLIVKIYNKFKL